jgi:hypothetical protein
MPGIEFNQGIPDDIDNAYYLDISQPNLIILDDLMAQSGKYKRIADLFTKGSHHRNLSIIYIVQNIIHQGKEMRNISLNAHYIVLFKSPRDKQQISMLARQINPGRVKEFMRSYEDDTSRPHGYLMLDLKPTTDHKQRLKTNILPREIAKFIQKQSYRQPPLVNVMYDAEQRMHSVSYSCTYLLRYHRKCLLLQYQLKYHHQCLLRLYLIFLRHHQPKVNDQNSSATFFTIG